MSLLDDFPHTIDVDSPTYSRDSTTYGNVISWASVATAVPCQVTSAGGSVGDRFGGEKLTQSKTLSLTQDVVRHGYRVTWNSNRYIVTGGVGEVEAIGGIPRFYTWTIERVTEGA